MSRTYTQKELFEYLKANPLGAVVWVGDLDDMNGENYIFLDYLDEESIPFDDSGCYRTTIQISVYVKDFINRKVLVDYVKPLSQFAITFRPSDEGNYHCAIMETTIFLK